MKNLPPNRAPDKIGSDFAPFAIGCRKFTARHGAQAWPLAGIGAFVATSDQPINIAVVPLAPLMAATGMLHMEHFAQSLEHKSARDLQVYRLLMDANAVAWIPYGMIAIPAGANAINTFRIYPWLSKTMYEDTGDAQKDLIRQGILGFAKKNCDKNPWHRMLGSLTAFFG